MTSWRHPYVFSNSPKSKGIFEPLTKSHTRVPQCAVWCQTGICHCNSHKKSKFWSDLRNSALLGGLQNFKLTLAEIDSHLRQAGSARLHLKSRCEARGHVSLNSGLSFRENAGGLQRGGTRALLYFSEGKAAKGLWTERSKSAKTHSRVSDRFGW